MKEKITQLMKSEGLTSSRLAEILEIQPSGISHIVSGRNKPGFDLLQKILRRFPRINPDWLLLDSDVMYRDPQESDASVASPSAADPLPFDLFGLGGSGDGAVAQNFEGQQGGYAAGFEGQKSGGNSGRDSGQNQGQNQGQNRPSNYPQNSPQFPPQNGVQNGPHNRPQNPQNFGASHVSVERIIVLYSDGTFRSYATR